MGVFQQGRNAGGWTGTSEAGKNLIDTLKDYEKANADKNKRVFVEDAFHIADISIGFSCCNKYCILLVIKKI